MSKIPLVPQWNLTNGCVCLPDGGFLYAGSRSINFISSIENEGDTPQIKEFHTRQSILSIDIDPHWGESSGELSAEKDDSDDNEPAKLFVALLQDNSVQIWDFNKGCALQGHKAHLACQRYMEGNGPAPQNAGDVFISYMINRNVLSVDSQDIVVYCVASNSFCRRAMFVSPRHHQLTAMKCSAYNENHFALGTSRGLVLVCDLQKMQTLFTLRGHNSTITSLAWNRIDTTESLPFVPEKVEIKPEKSAKAQKFTRADATIDTDDIFDIYDYDYLENEFGATPHDAKAKADVSDFVGIEKSDETSTAAAQFDFAEACQNLKEEINALRSEQPQLSPEHIVSLEDCKSASARDDTSSCGSDGESEHSETEKKSSDGSMVRLICGTPSSEESVFVDGAERVVKQQLVCQADVHVGVTQPEMVDNKPHQTAVNEIEQDVPKNIDDKNSDSSVVTSDILLASVSHDGSICFWNASTGATCDQHKMSGSRTAKSKKYSKFRISWLNATSLMVCNNSGELQIWALQKLPIKDKCVMPKTNMYKFKKTKREWQQKAIVSFAVCQSRKLLWCISSHREVSMEDMENNKLMLQYSCVSTNISALRECPDDMNKIAMGFSDRRIGIIDISKISPNFVHIENFVQRIESAVTSLVWSPDCKRLAYGTQEGRIGVICVESAQKQSFAFNSVCGKPIYSICWQDKYLFVVCNYRIAVYEDNVNNKDAYVLPGIHDVSALSLRNNYLFVGTEKGRLRLYENKASENSSLKYDFKMELELSSRYISEISWSPIATNKLATTANANHIHILEFKDETGELQIVRKLEIKSSKATNACAKWSNRNENLLLTCGFDGAIRVWDLSQESNNEHFLKMYHCPMKCGLFLPTDEDILLCAGKSTSLEFIDMRIVEANESSVKSKHSRTLDNVQWATKASTRHEGNVGPGDRKSIKIIDLTSNSIENQANGTITNSEKAEPIQSDINPEQVTTMLEKLNIQKVENSVSTSSIYMKIPLTLLYLTTKEINKDALDIMKNILNMSFFDKKVENKSLCAKLFGSKSEATQLLAEELKNHQNSETKGISNLFMPQLNANLKEEILKCVQNKQLCEWHVSLAPSISYSFWQKCCQAYAEQLLEQGYVLQCVVYMLAIHLQHDAIEILIQKAYFKEALLIARIYLQPKDPLVNKITEEWIMHLFNNGNLTGAALLCLLSKQNTRAYECLVKIRNTGPEIEQVIRLLKESENLN